VLVEVSVDGLGVVVVELVLPLMVPLPLTVPPGCSVVRVVSLDVLVLVWLPGLPAVSSRRSHADIRPKATSAASEAVESVFIGNSLGKTQKKGPNALAVSVPEPRPGIGADPIICGFCVPHGRAVCRRRGLMGHAPGHHSDTKHDLPHEGPIKTPKQLIAAVFFAFVVPIIAIVLLVTYVASEHKPAAGSEGFSEQAVAQRIKPVGMVEVKDLSDPAALKPGDQVYAAQCVACHATGAVNAPKLGDAAAWGPRLKQGYEALVHSSLKGKGNMPAQGGGDFTDLEIARAVVHMANQAGAKFAEPKAAPVVQAAAPAAADPAAANAAAAVAAALATAAKPTAAAPAAAGGVPTLYAQACQACHAAGVANAPKLGDKAAWAPRLVKGVDGLTATVIQGKGAMPPRGGSSASDAELKTAVAYMVGTVK